MISNFKKMSTYLNLSRSAICYVVGLNPTGSVLVSVCYQYIVYINLYGSLTYSDFSL